MAPIIHIENVHKHFGRIRALRGVSLDVNESEVVVIVGPPVRASLPCCAASTGWKNTIPARLWLTA